MKVGLIGTGFGTRVHMPAMRANADIEVVAICSAHRARAEAAARNGESSMPPTIIAIYGP